MIYNRIEKNLKVWYFSIKGIYNYFIDYTKCTYINWVQNKSTQKIKLNEGIYAKMRSQSSTVIVKIKNKIS